MIVSMNPQPTLSEFKALMQDVDRFLEQDAAMRPAYYRSHSGSLLEDDVKNALDVCAKGTPFEGTIKKISGQKFPDIIAANLYGVEVKSTNGDHWISTGSSILESTRISSVERIFLTFGKLGGERIEFLSRPYEECLYGIAVTHMPRYLINMKLDDGETIFDKMGIPYDKLRNMDDPIAPVADYYRSRLKDGERLWWTSTADEAVSAKITLWRNLSKEQKRMYIVYACVNFPEIFGGDYSNYALWLASQGVVDPHIRDEFSAGGQGIVTLENGNVIPVSGVYRRVENNAQAIIDRLSQADPAELCGAAADKNSALQTNLRIWADAVSIRSALGYVSSMQVLAGIFPMLRLS